LSLAFEDAEGVDYDYNDWVVDLQTVATQDELGRVTGIDFDFFPEARGAWHRHVFHMRFPAGIFEGPVNATLTLYDADGLVISTEGITFDGAVGHDFTVIPNTMEALPNNDPPFWERYTNTVEPYNSEGVVSHFQLGNPHYVNSHVPPEITARLSLQLAPEDDFVLPDYEMLLTDWLRAARGDVL
jgi:LruC domain-containing protein